MELLDYATLRVIWWILLGVLLIGFAIMGGLDIGAAILLPFVAHDDEERRRLIAVGSILKGNQVWLLLGGVAVFTAWPLVSATVVSCFIVALVLVLLTLLLRPLGFAARDKIAPVHRRNAWDWGLFAFGLVPAFVFGATVGSLFLGLPFTLDEHRLPHYEGGPLDVFHPFALFTGLVSIGMLVTHGAAFLTVKAEPIVAARSRVVGLVCAYATAAIFITGGFWIGSIDGYFVLESDPNGPSDTSAKAVATITGFWLQNITSIPLAISAPIISTGGLVLTGLALRNDWPRTAFTISSTSIIAIVATAGLALFPFIIPSSLDPNQSLTLWDASSSRNTLLITLAATVVLMPLVVAGTPWLYRVLGGRIASQKRDGQRLQ